jgi:hypothetical protein
MRWPCPLIVGGARSARRADNDLDGAAFRFGPAWKERERGAAILTWRAADVQAHATGRQLVTLEPLR